MKNNYTLFPLFSKPVYTRIIEDIDDKEILEINNLIDKEEYDTSGNKNNPNFRDKIQNSKASETKILLNKPEFKSLKNILLNEFNYFKNEILRFNNNNFDITTSWIAKTEPGEESEYHNHHNCYYSGVFYTKVNDKTGNIVFENFSDNKRFLIIPKEYNIFNSNNYYIEPKNKMILFFPSEMYHKIYKNTSNITRYSIAFNLVPTGVLGDGDSTLVLG
jgi:uncharacterized protein (TIGR02466 family)